MDVEILRGRSAPRYLWCKIYFVELPQSMNRMHCLVIFDLFSKSMIYLSSSTSRCSFTVMGMLGEQSSRCSMARVKQVGWEGRHLGEVVLPCPEYIKTAA